MIRRGLELGWPTALVAAACVGLAASNWLRVSPLACGITLALVALGAAASSGTGRVVLLTLGLTVAGLWWGGIRSEALGRSVLLQRLGTSADAAVVVTGPARRTRFALRVPAEVRRFGELRVHERVLLELPPERAPPLGAVIELRARPVAPRRPEAGFDERGWLARRGVHVVLRGGEFRIIGRRGGIGGVADLLHSHIATALAHGASGERRAVLEGVVLGEDDRLERELRDQFKASGLYHLLAVSGQNVAFIVVGMLGIGWLLGLPRLAAEVGALVAVGTYTLAVGWQPSVVRAGVAGVLASLAWLASRPRDRWHFLTLGAFVLLAWTPATLLDPGFQLSFAAVAAIFVGVPWLDRRLEDVPLPFALPRPVRGAIAVSTACGIATAPILWVDFRRVPIWSVVANALADPAVGPLLGLGLAAALVAPVLPSAAAGLSWLAGWPAAWIALSARLVARLPYASSSSLATLVLLAAGATGAVALRRLPAWRWPLAAAAIVLPGILGAAFWILARLGEA